MPGKCDSQYVQLCLQWLLTHLLLLKNTWAGVVCGVLERNCHFESQPGRKASEGGFGGLVTHVSLGDGRRGCFMNACCLQGRVYSLCIPWCGSVVLNTLIWQSSLSWPFQKEITCALGPTVSALCISITSSVGFPCGSAVKNLPATQLPWETQVQSLGGEYFLEEGMATHSSILAWRIPMDRGAWQATVHRAAKSETCLKRLSKHTSHYLYNSVELTFHSYIPSCACMLTQSFLTLSGDLPRAIFSLLMSLIIQLPELCVVLHLLLSGTPRIRFCDKHKLKLKTTNKNPAVWKARS